MSIPSPPKRSFGDAFRQRFGSPQPVQILLVSNDCECRCKGVVRSKGSYWEKNWWFLILSKLPEQQSLSKADDSSHLMIGQRHLYAPSLVLLTLCMSPLWPALYRRMVQCSIRNQRSISTYLRVKFESVENSNDKETGKGYKSQSFSMF